MARSISRLIFWIGLGMVIISFAGSGIEALISITSGDKTIYGSGFYVIVMTIVSVFSAVLFSFMLTPWSYFFWAGVGAILISTFFGGQDSDKYEFGERTPDD